MLRVLRRQPAFIFLFFAFIAASLLSPIASDTTIPNLADYMNHLAGIIQAKTALMEGQFPLRVAPSESLGWRYPLYQFSSPSVYTFTGLLYAWITPSNPLVAYKITMWCGLMLGAIYMYRLAYWFFGSKPAAILAGVVYIYAPYYIIVANYLGSLTETVGLGLLPAVIYYTLQRYYHPNSNRLLLQTGIAWYLLMTSHIVTFVYASFFSALLLLLITAKNPRHRRPLIAVGIAYAFGCMLGMWFLAPAGALSKFFLLGPTYTDPNYLNLFHPMLSQLLFSAAALTLGYKSNALLSIHPSIGWPIVMAAGLCFYAYLHQQSSGNRRGDYWLPSLLILFVVAFVLVWSPVDVWRFLPQPLLIGQHSWRLLDQVIWIGALLFGWAMCWLFQRRMDMKHVIIGTLLIALSANAWFPQAESGAMTLADFIKRPLLIYNSHAYSFDVMKYNRLVDKIDNFLLDPNPTLKLNGPLHISKIMLKYTSSPTVNVEGHIPAAIGNDSLQLSAEENGVRVSTVDLHTGLLNWTIPLHAVTDTKNTVDLGFKITRRDHQKLLSVPSIPVDRVLLKGFLTPSATLTVKDIEPTCKQQNTTTVCQLTVPSTINLLELPVLYYPNLLHVTLNGKTVPYHDVLYHGLLMTTVEPIAGQNTIAIQFRGLRWANTVSLIAWGLGLILLGEIIWKRRVLRRVLKGDAS